MFKMTTQPMQEDGTLLANRKRLISHPKRDDELLNDAVMEVLAAYGGVIDGREQEFNQDVMIASSMKGLGWNGKKRKRKGRW